MSNSHSEKMKRHRTKTPVDTTLLDNMSGDEIKAILAAAGDAGHRALNRAKRAAQQQNADALKNDEEYQRRVKAQKDAKKQLDDARRRLTPDADGNLPIDHEINRLEEQIAERKRTKVEGLASIHDGSDGQPEGHFYKSYREATKRLVGYNLNLRRKGVATPVVNSK